MPCGGGAHLYKYKMLAMVVMSVLALASGASLPVRRFCPAWKNGTTAFNTEMDNPTWIGKSGLCSSPLS
jgi:hypothetical protein